MAKNSDSGLAEGVEMEPGLISFAGMTVNERLYVSGLMVKFDDAVEKMDADKARSILEKVWLTEESIKPILEKHGL